MPPPRPPTRTAIGFAPGDEDPEKKRKKNRDSEIVRINLPLNLSAEPAIQLPLLPGGVTATSENILAARSMTALTAVLWIITIWTFIGAAVSTVLRSGLF